MIKNLLVLFLLTLGFVGIQAQSLKINDPVKYNDYIVDQQNIIGNELLKLIAMFDSLPQDKSVAMDQLSVVVAAAKSGIANVKNLKPISNEFGLRQAAIELFQFYELTMDTDYRTIIDQLYLEAPDVEVLKEVLTRVQTAEAVVDGIFQAAQTEYAKYHNITLEENELQEEFDDTEGGA